MTFSWTSYLADGLAPPWLCGPWGNAWLTAKGQEKDRLELRTITGLKARFPSYCPGDGLYLHGRARGGIERAPGESDAVYASRLCSAFATWKWSGTNAGILNAFAALGWQVTTFSTDDMSWPTTWPTDGHVWIRSAWEWACPDGDDAAEHSARGRVIVDGYAEGIGATTQTIGDGSTIGADDKAIGIDQPATTVALWKRLVRKWKDAKSTFPGMFVIVSNGGFQHMVGGAGVVGDGTTIGGEVLAIPIGE